MRSQAKPAGQGQMMQATSRVGRQAATHTRTNWLHLWVRRESRSDDVMLLLLALSISGLAECLSDPFS
jgi:hypothetical protein